MAEILFVVKTFVCTCVLVFILQYKVGEQTLEARLHAFLQHSTAVGWLRTMGEGAVRLTASTYKNVKQSPAVKKPHIPFVSEVLEVKGNYNQKQKDLKKALDQLEDPIPPSK